MLELRPTCEHCNKALPPHSTDAMICSFECTFCRDCVDLLQNVCPNCGGGFTPRPIRPAHAWLPGVSLDTSPASRRITHKHVDLERHAALVAMLDGRPPERR
ncbi:DUF1272 domain-containing protein [Dyella solisilvae]|uniref:DUF1272 domain-containing protein n=1 Tax=Dyella solisilvae TaxID=1920168 RepID=A0A370K8M0_9GAMM|nr:DUF1272 domain-containing protein [Dyella solisilvae]RDI99001.1 DUF1272 domain-containing protein [Dyella solisilvae]